MRIDALQYVNPSQNVFEQMSQGGMDAIHITVGYHEDFDGVVRNLGEWNTWIERFPDMLARATTTQDILRARADGKTAILFGLQNPLAIGADLRRVEVLHQMGIKFCQVTYNQQSLLGAGCFEPNDSGLTDFGVEAVLEMNRIGMVVDLSHAGPKTCLDVIKTSKRPVAITHANAKYWRDVPRNWDHELMQALSETGGAFGFSLYPHHLKNGSDCSFQEFADMVAHVTETYGAGMFGIGSDLCQDQPDSVVNWMRNGHWRKVPVTAVTFPKQPNWFRDNRDFDGIEKGLVDHGLDAGIVAGIMGQNWFNFFERSFLPHDQI